MSPPAIINPRPIHRANAPNLKFRRTPRWASLRMMIRVGTRNGASVAIYHFSPHPNFDAFALVPPYINLMQRCVIQGIVCPAQIPAYGYFT